MVKESAEWMKYDYAKWYCEVTDGIDRFTDNFLVPLYITIQFA